MKVNNEELLEEIMKEVKVGDEFHDGKGHECKVTKIENGLIYFEPLFNDEPWVGEIKEVEFLKAWKPIVSIFDDVDGDDLEIFKQKGYRVSIDKRKHIVKQVEDIEALQQHARFYGPVVITELGSIESLTDYLDERNTNTK